ncbi:MAG TPA: family 10 glycosylhydrolase [Herpetosiphonaceae bacterium]|nr:family 10 glycosylhydrolase [Herpetosiphonaceae bacterium]
MDRLVRLLGVVAMLFGVLAVTPMQAASPEFRAYWVDAFGPGIYNEQEIDKLVAATKAANMNAIIAQIGRRGDCFCNKAIMPRTQAAIAPLPFDPLQSLIDKAHAQGIEVHAWVITTAIWNSITPPLASNHVFNTHGPSKTGYDNWIMLRYDGANRGGADYYLDPGHPDAADYIVKMYTSIVENYDVDGINFDRVRYPDFNLGINVPSWGYNPAAVARFQAATGRGDRPTPTDAQWMQWRRDQVTNIVRRVYLESYALKPHLRVSADTITYGYGPQGQGGWENTRTYVEVLQDWRGWMEEGILDLNIPMNYKREHCVQDGPGCFGNQRLMYEQWNEFAKDNQHDRQVAIGSAIYLNSIEGSVAQVRKALAPSAAGNPSSGWVGYSYRTPDALTNTGARSGDASRAELTRALTQPSEYDPITPPVIAGAATVPAMTWKTQPAMGHLSGTVKTDNGTPFDQVRVELYDAETDAFIAARVTDGSGWFGFVDLQPGRYKVIVDGARATGRRVAVASVAAGQLTTVALTPFARGQEGRQPVRPAVGRDPGEAQVLPNGER